MNLRNSGYSWRKLSSTVLASAGALLKSMPVSARALSLAARAGLVAVSMRDILYYKGITALQHCQKHL